MRYYTAALSLLLSATLSQAQPSGLTDELVLDGWDQAVGVRFADDGRAFVWEKAGRVWLVENGVRNPTPVIDISEEVGNWVDHGLLGFALDPNYLSNGRIYLLYVVDYHHLMHFGTPQYNPNLSVTYTDTIARLTRYSCNASDGFRTADVSTRAVLVGESISTGFPICNQSHGTGTIQFGADGSLLAGVGDGASFVSVDAGGPQLGSTYTALADGILTPDQDVGAYRAQLLESLSGKIIRIDPETGDALPGNPFYEASAPRSARSRLWCLGLRNPFRWSIRPGSGGPTQPGTLYIGDVGWFDREEINVAPVGGLNFGWPIFEGLLPGTRYVGHSPMNLNAPNPLAGGACPSHFLFDDLIIQDTLATPSWPNPCDSLQQVPASIATFVHTRPRVEWGHSGPTRVPIYSGQSADVSDISSPTCPVDGFLLPGSSSTGGVWYDGSTLPPEYHGSYFQADWSGGWIHQFNFDQNDQLVEFRPFHPTAGAVVCLAVGPQDGSLYYVALQYNGASVLRRIRTATVNEPPTAVAQASPQFGPSPLVVQFSSNGSSDPQATPLDFLWDFGDGSPPSTDPNPIHTFDPPAPAEPRRFDVVLTVTDPEGATDTRTIIVSTDNTPPSAQILSPLAGSAYIPPTGLIVPLSASISDAEYSAAQLSCAWQVLLRHNDHLHPGPVDTACETQATFTPHGNAGDTYSYEVHLTVTDPLGLSTSSSVEVFPQPCPADLDGGAPAGTPDGGIDITDLLFFLSSFEAGAPGADIDDDGIDPQNPDGGIDIADLLFFLRHFEAGC